MNYQPYPQRKSSKKQFSRNQGSRQSLGIMTLRQNNPQSCTLATSKYRQLSSSRRTRQRQQSSDYIRNLYKKYLGKQNLQNYTQRKVKVDYKADLTYRDAKRSLFSGNEVKDSKPIFNKKIGQQINIIIQDVQSCSGGRKTNEKCQKIGGNEKNGGGTPRKSCEKKVNKSKYDSIQKRSKKQQLQMKMVESKRKKVPESSLQKSQSTHQVGKKIKLQNLMTQARLDSEDNQYMNINREMYCQFNTQDEMRLHSFKSQGVWQSLQSFHLHPFGGDSCFTKTLSKIDKWKQNKQKIR